jgi:hypothetical protein
VAPSQGELRLSNPGQLALLEALTERGASLHTTVRGSSMTPFIRDEDAVTIAPMNGILPSIGEVVAFLTPGGGRLAVHRVVGRAQGGWLIRGDSCAKPDGTVATEKILGRVVSVERKGRRVGFGSGAAAAMIAALSRRGLLRPIYTLMALPRRAVGYALRHTLGWCKRIGRDR